MNEVCLEEVLTVENKNICILDEEGNKDSTSVVNYLCFIRNL